MDDKKKIEIQENTENDETTEEVNKEALEMLTGNGGEEDE